MAFPRKISTKGLVSLLAPAIIAGGLSLAKPALAQTYDVAEINVTLADGVTPAPHKLVELDVDNDSLYDLFEFTDVNGQARFSNVVSVEDSDRDGLMDSWELEHFGSVGRYGSLDDPDRDGRSNLREYQLGSNPTLADIVNSHMRLAMGPIKGNVNFATPRVDFFANAGENVSLGVYDVRGRLITQTSGVGDLSVSMPSGVADGKYFALLRSENDMAVASFVNLGGVQSLSASRLSLDEAVSQGMVADKSVDKDESQLMNIRISGEGYNTEVHQENVVPGVNVFSYMLTPSGMSTRFRVTDGTADNWLQGLTLNLRGPDGQVFNSVSGADGELNITIPSTYALTDSFAVFISNTPGFSNNVYGMIAWPNAVNKIASTDGMYAIKADTAKVALDQIINTPEGVGFVPLPDSMYDDVEFRDMANDAEAHTGNRDYFSANLTFVNYLKDRSGGVAGFDISPARIQVQQDVIDFYMPQFLRDSGLIIANVNSIQSSADPSPIAGNIMIYQRNDVGPGNVRGPPGLGQMQYGLAFTPENNPLATLILETGSLLGIMENASSTNNPGFTIDGGIISDLSEKGKHLMVYWGTHGTNDGRF